MGKLGKLLKKAMVVSMEDQITYCNKTIQVGPHVLVVTTATVDTTGERARGSKTHDRIVEAQKKVAAHTCDAAVDPAVFGPVAWFLCDNVGARLSDAASLEIGRDARYYPRGV